MIGMRKIKIFSLLFIALFIAIFSFFAFSFALSFTFGFISFLFIILATFYAQRKKIRNLIANASEEELQALSEMYKSKEEKEEEFWEEQNDKQRDCEALQIENKKMESKSDFIPKKRRFWENFNKNNVKLGVRTFFIPLRIIAYIFLILGFFILLKKDVLDVLGLVSGILFANVCVVMVAFFFIFFESKQGKSLTLI